MRSALVEKFEEQTEALSTLKVALGSPKYFSNTQVDRIVRLLFVDIDRLLQLGLSS